jgi:hypothetical protein
MSRETKNVIELKCDPAKLKRLNELFPNDRPTPIEYDACVAHALMRAHKDYMDNPKVSGAAKLAAAVVRVRAAEILESEFGIKP